MVVRLGRTLTFSCLLWCRLKTFDLNPFFLDRGTSLPAGGREVPDQTDLGKRVPREGSGVAS